MKEEHVLAESASMYKEREENRQLEAIGMRAIKIDLFRGRFLSAIMKNSDDILEWTTVWDTTLPWVSKSIKGLGFHHPVEMLKSTLALDCSFETKKFPINRSFAVEGGEFKGAIAITGNALYISLSKIGQLILVSYTLNVWLRTWNKQPCQGFRWGAWQRSKLLRTQKAQCFPLFATTARYELRRRVPHVARSFPSRWRL